MTLVTHPQQGRSAELFWLPVDRLPVDLHRPSRTPLFWVVYSTMSLVLLALVFATYGWSPCMGFSSLLIIPRC